MTGERSLKAKTGLSKDGCKKLDKEGTSEIPATSPYVSPSEQDASINTKKKVSLYAPLKILKPDDASFQKSVNEIYEIMKPHILQTSCSLSLKSVNNRFFKRGNCCGDIHNIVKV